MSMKRYALGLTVAAGALAAGAWTAATPAQAAEPFTITSSTFKDGTMLQKKNAGTRPGNANCVGEDVSPELSWSNPPAGTKSFALTMVDAEGRGGLGVDHWIAYGIPASVTSFAEGEGSKPSDKFVGGTGTNKNTVYGGPCTPPGAAHHYNITLIATDLDPKALKPGLTKEELFKALAGHAKGATGIVGLFKHP
ncbi:MAG TPA: YbhB/YbcL family Raf kinase inhibitor-like protein [Xanthobacteraceae bacterium]|jgi:Raf kinase inhibitor-like YbhB/YbcL family protein|nr:YbhB/YbcL family Raf kinase inhibitor-like protein [Xanthobacteraceae bacterium]